MKASYIIFICLIFLTTCEKKEYFDLSLIPGHYSSHAEECTFIRFDTLSGFTVCRKENCRIIIAQYPLSYSFVEYDSFISKTEGDRYFIELDVDDPTLPKEIEIELNGKYYSRNNLWPTHWIYFDVIETDYYENILCGYNNENHGNYFYYMDTGDDFQLSYKFHLLSKTGDSLIWTFYGRQRVN